MWCYNILKMYYYGGNLILSTKITEAKITELLDWSYDKAINGLPGMETVEEFVVIVYY